MARNAPVDPHDPGLARRVRDSEAFIFVQETWRWFLLIVAFSALVLGVMFEDERGIQAGLVIAALFAVLIAVEWWQDRQAPLPKPKTKPDADA